MLAQRVVEEGKIAKEAVEVMERNINEAEAVAGAYNRPMCRKIHSLILLFMDAVLRSLIYHLPLIPHIILLLLLHYSYGQTGSEPAM